MEFKDYLKKYRKLNNLTQKELADLLKKNPVTVARYETGVITPPLSVIKEIANILKISENELLAGEKIKLFNFNIDDLTTPINFKEIEQKEEELTEKLLKIYNEEIEKIFYLEYGLNLTEEQKKLLTMETKKFIDFLLYRTKNLQVFGSKREPQD